MLLALVFAPPLWGVTPDGGAAVGKLDPAALDAVAEQGRARTRVPGMVISIVHRDRVVYLKGFGVRKAGESAKIDPDTVFQIASVSKPFTSTVLARLVGEGAISWDSRLAEIDPNFKLYDPQATAQVTIRDLLSHRSGLPEHAGDLLEDLGYDRPAILYRLRFVKPSGKFRESYHYTNFGFTEAAVTGAGRVHKTWEDLIAETLFRPLGMTRSSARFADYRDAANKAALHVLVDGKMVAKSQRDPDAQSPAGGVSTTGRDIAQWLRLQLANGMLDGRPLIATGALAETHRPQPNGTTDKRYGLGWNVAEDAERGGLLRLNHSGAFSRGADTHVLLVPKENLGIAILTNAAPTGLAEAVADAFIDLYFDGRVNKDWVGIWIERWRELEAQEAQALKDYSKLKPPAQPKPGRPPAVYAGRYENAYFGVIEVRQDAGKLRLVLGPKGLSLPLTHWDGDTFTYDFDTEMDTGRRAATFTVGSGKAGKLVLDNLEPGGDGTFYRVAVRGARPGRPRQAR
jgi:CubicO group peptidase (beta-lactamase class C family)